MTVRGIATGSGDNGARVKEMADAAGDAVVHLGVQAPETVALILQCSDLFALPSLFEGLPLTMLEAAACGCPCLVSAAPTIRTWVPPEWGRARPLRANPAARHH